MEKRIYRYKQFVTTITLAVFVFSCPIVFAQPHAGPERRGPGERPHGPGDYRWRDGYWWVGDVITALTIGTVIATLPPRREVVYVENAPYYYDGVYYYRRCPTGYVVVADPAVVVPATPVTVVATAKDDNTITVNIPNKDGSFMPVTLTKHKNGYLGPQGEYYQGHPTIEQLKVLYGN